MTSTTNFNPRSVRVGGIAVADVVLAVAIIRIFFGFSYFISLVVAFTLGILVHYMFNIPTTLNYYLGLSIKP